MSKLESSPEAPLPLRRISQALADWIGRLGEVWVEGQVAQFVRRPGVSTYFLTLRDVVANISIQVTCHHSVLVEPLAEGTRVVLRARPDFYAERGTLSLRATEIRQVGLGELLARIERLKQLLAAEGLFAASRKRPLPFLPRTIGLITGRASAAERDVVENTLRRLPGAVFAIENTATQGSTAVSEIIAALRRLDARADVDVIVIARGGGSVEDLLPFSNEGLLRAVAELRTPVVSAIGHETDQPLLDLVADLAVSTPTDAAKRIVPDLAAELGPAGRRPGPVAGQRAPPARYRGPADGGTAAAAAARGGPADRAGRRGVRAGRAAATATCWPAGCSWPRPTPRNCWPGW